MPEPFVNIRRTIRWIRAGLAEMYWSLLGKWIGNPPMPEAPGSVLFICLGNVCRSPFAERYLQKIAVERNIRGIRSRSAGLEVRKSASPPDLAVRIAKTFDVDLHDHRSLQVTEKMVGDSDMIFAMEHRQAAILRRGFPEHGSKIFLLPLFDPAPFIAGNLSTKYNIPDPYGMSEKDFIECFRKIERSIDGFLSRS